MSFVVGNYNWPKDEDQALIESEEESSSSSEEPKKPPPKKPEEKKRKRNLPKVLNTLVFLGDCVLFLSFMLTVHSWCREDFFVAEGLR